MLRRVDRALKPLTGQEPAKTAAAPTRTAAGPASDAAASTTPSAPPLPWAEWLALLTVAGTTLAALRKALTAFGADPAALLAGGLQGMKPKLAAEQNSFRTRFAEQFGEVSRALPERVVVVIDDLDRCRPEAVLEIMEAVNFLTSSGQCFVLFGMATDKVQAALAIAFERIAKELASASASDANANPEQAAREQRRAYAANYLQKLINLEIKVPTAQSYEAWRLLTDDPAMAASSSWRREAMQGLRRHAMWLALAGAIAGGVSLGVLLRPQLPLKAQAQDLATGPVLTAASALEAAAVASAASAPRGYRHRALAHPIRRWPGGDPPRSRRRGCSCKPARTVMRMHGSWPACWSSAPRWRDCCSCAPRAGAIARPPIPRTSATRSRSGPSGSASPPTPRARSSASATSCATSRCCSKGKRAIARCSMTSRRS